jgi:hypothetical protein
VTGDTDGRHVVARRVPGFLAVVAVAALVAGGCGTSKSTGDAAVTACTADSGGGQPTAQGTVRNTSSKTSTFVLRIGFYDSSDNRVSDAVVNVGDVEPAATGQWQTTGAASAKGPLTCKVLSLNRTSIGNS